MSPRAIITAESEAADDWDFSDAGDVLSPGGHAALSWLLGRLPPGFQTIDEPKNHEDYGWSAIVGHLDERYWLLIAMGMEEGTVNLTIEPKISVGQRLLFARQDRPLKDFADHVVKLLDGDVRFSNVRLEIRK